MTPQRIVLFILIMIPLLTVLLFQCGKTGAVERHLILDRKMQVCEHIVVALEEFHAENKKYPDSLEFLDLMNHHQKKVDLWVAEETLLYKPAADRLSYRIELYPFEDALINTSEEWHIFDSKTEGWSTIIR